MVSRRCDVCVGYIPWERARSSEVEEAPRAKSEALPRLHESASPFPRDITGRTSRQHVIQEN